MTAPAPSPERRSKRIYIYWGVALTLLVTVALVCWLVVVPVLDVRATVGRCRGRDPDFGKEIAHLGGPQNAAHRLTLYLKLPAWLVSDRPQAARLLGKCGDWGLSALYRLQKDKDEHPDVRNEAVEALAMLPYEHYDIGMDGDIGRLINVSRLILLLRLEPVDAQGRARSRIVRCVKAWPGVSPYAPVIGFSATVRKEQAKVVKKAITGQGAGPVLFFLSQDSRGDDVVFLHSAGRWIRLEPGPEKNSWNVYGIEMQMDGIWAGGTDMLLRLCDLVAENPDTYVPIVPILTGCEWGTTFKIGKVEGRVCAVRAVDLDGNGRLALHVASDGGDRLFRYDAGLPGFADVTARRKLAARSRAFAWGDFNGDGLLDLASWDGTSISIWRQDAKGAFSRGKPVWEGPGCLGLTAMDVGAGPRAALLVSSADPPVLLVPGKGSGFEKRSLQADAAMLKPLGELGACLVADLDGDGLADVLQTGEKGSLLYRGKGKGGFATARKCAVALGKSPSSAFLGDWDQDGRLDVLAAAKDGPRLWHNYGGSGFKNMMSLSAEMAYISKPGGIGGVTCDVNNDGLQDILITYDKMAPQVFFNRGFRSFGHAHTLDLAEKELLPAASDGTRAGTIAELTGDGAQDMALVLRDGDLWVFPRKVEVDDDEKVSGVSVALAPGGAFAGPVTVTGWNVNKGRCLGAWNVVPGTQEAFFGAQSGDEITVKWRLPGGQEQTRTVGITRKPVRLVIGAPRKP